MATSRFCFSAKLERFNACTELIDYICMYNGLHINMNALHVIVLSVQNSSTLNILEFSIISFVIDEFKNKSLKLKTNELKQIM